MGAFALGSFVEKLFPFVIFWDGLWGIDPAARFYRNRPAGRAFMKADATATTASNHGHGRHRPKGKRSDLLANEAHGSHKPSTAIPLNLTGKVFHISIV